MVDLNGRYLDPEQLLTEMGVEKEIILWAHFTPLGLLH
jgi:hypothetical protein